MNNVGMICVENVMGMETGWEWKWNGNGNKNGNGNGNGKRNGYLEMNDEMKNQFWELKWQLENKKWLN